MKKLKIVDAERLTLKNGCELYLDDCRQRNLREGTIKHYRQSYLKLYGWYGEDFPLDNITSKTYGEYVEYLCETLDNDVSVNAYLRDFITTLHFLMNEGYIEAFKMKSIKVDKTHIETYSDEELKILLKKPNLKQCSFTEYQCWVMTNFLFCTGVRQRSLMNIRIKDIDFSDSTVHVNVTKNRKPLIIPLNKSLLKILREYLTYRQHNSDDDFLFCNSFGNPLVKSTCYHMLYFYNKCRGVETTGIHRYRHTFAKQWIVNGGNVVVLSKLLGHSNLAITQNYINLLVSDLAKEVDEINLLDKYKENKSIKMKEMS